MNTIVLASGSPRRRELLEKFNIETIIEKPIIEEKFHTNNRAENIAMALAFEKAYKISQNYNNGEIILGADTLVVCNGKILGKPESEKEAINMLKALSGKEHMVITGLAVLKAGTNLKIIDYEKTYVKFRKLDGNIIKSYIATGEYMDKAGSYGIQDIGSVLVEGIKGCYFNVIGLPLYRLDIILNEHFDINLL